MKTIDAIQDKDIRILRILYDNWKKTHKGRLAFDAEPYNPVDIYRAAGVPKDQFYSHLKNLERIDFVSLADGEVKLMPSGINYCLGQFDRMTH